MSKREQAPPQEQQKKDETAVELVERLKPLEEQQGDKIPTGPLEGAIRVDESHLPIPQDIMESRSKSRLGIETVVIVIAGLMLIFIALIAWQISMMPGPAKP